MQLTDLMQRLDVKELIGKPDRSFKQLDFDSRKVVAGSIFFAIYGTLSNGHDYVENAIQKGAVAVVVEQLPEVLHEAVTYVLVESSNKAFGHAACWYHDDPSHQLQLIGVTGTNGKTTTVNLLYDLFKGLGYKVGLISTIENRIGAEVVSATNTTPYALELNALLAQMVEAGCDYVFMEVSSHATVQERIAGLRFRGGVFTNMSHDHLDYHKTFKAYIEAKKMFFDNLPKTAFALVNVDDKRGTVMVQNTRAKVYHYSLRTLSEFRAKVIENSISGLHLKINEQDFFARLIGEFNAYNLLAVYSVALILGYEPMEVLQELSKIKSAEGRFETLFSEKRNVTGIVDYSHTPDALEKVLQTIADLKAEQAKVLTVVGCGGDRDREKRPKMAKIACTYSDQVVLTSDNPRSEEPMAIIQEMERGIPPNAASKVLINADRKQAIRMAVRLAKAGDVILVAGKGHEKYQEIKGVRHDFDDRAVLQKEFEIS
ncbi:MAG: UDP-N-acetylmuramoyl-L-alanyl-D-glutamate--2,6-diaminopimelate ligase [Bacteroidota bacterium]